MSGRCLPMSSPNTSSDYWAYVKYEDIIHETPRATLFLIGSKECWLPKGGYRIRNERVMAVRRNLVDEKGLLEYFYRHIPPKLEVVYDQQPIDEVRFDPSERC